MTENTTARYWLVQLPDGREIVRRYQEAVTAERVLSEHRSALAAWPLESFPARSRAGNSNPDISLAPNLPIGAIQ